MNFSVDGGFGWLGGGGGLILLMMLVAFVLGSLHYRNVEKPERDRDIADEREAERRQWDADHEERL